MKIQSNFKDYYDYIAWQYGGGDPKFVYLRHRSSSSRIFIDRREAAFNIQVKGIPSGEPMRWYDYLFFCGDVYLIDQEKITEKVTKVEPCGECYFCRLNLHSNCGNSNYRLLKPLKDIALKHNEPVFQYTSGLGAGEIWIPTLKDIGFDKFETDPEKVYHRIEDYKRNVLTPVVEISGTMQTDKEKTASHGFDVKQSFRHRK